MLEQVYGILQIRGLPIKYNGFTLRNDLDGRGAYVEDWDEGLLGARPTEAELASASPVVDHVVARAEEYDPIPDQLDRVTKVLKYLSANGVDIGPDGTDQVTMSDAVKAAHPKPV